MRNTTKKKNIGKIQIPISTEIRLKSENKAKSQGFSSIQEVVRVFLYQYASDKINFGFEAEQLEPEFEEKVLEIIRTNQYLAPQTGTDFINQLIKSREKNHTAVKTLSKTA